MLGPRRKIKTARRCLVPSQGIPQALRAGTCLQKIPGVKHPALTRQAPSRLFTGRAGLASRRLFSPVGLPTFPTTVTLTRFSCARTPWQALQIEAQLLTSGHYPSPQRAFISADVVLVLRRFLLSVHDSFWSAWFSFPNT